jgi:hypothetical protein
MSASVTIMRKENGVETFLGIKFDRTMLYPQK